MVCPPLPTGRRRTGISNIRCASQPPPPNGKIVPCGTGNSRAERSRVFKVSCLLLSIAPGTFSFACQKRTRKAPATFEAREAAGCGSLRLLRALRGTRILQAAVPTAPPCFGHWPRSSPLQTRGCSPLVTPKLLGSIQKIQVASLKDFLCSADWKPLSRCATVPSKREPLAKPQALRFARKLCRYAKGSPFGRAGKPDRA